METGATYPEPILFPPQTLSYTLLSFLFSVTPITAEQQKILCLEDSSQEEITINP